MVAGWAVWLLPYPQGAAPSSLLRVAWGSGLRPRELGSWSAAGRTPSRSPSRAGLASLTTVPSGLREPRAPRVAAAGDLSSPRCSVITFLSALQEVTAF